VLCLYAFRRELTEALISISILGIICFVIYYLSVMWGYMPNPNDKKRQYTDDH
jgi:hypothetical protein